MTLWDPADHFNNLQALMLAILKASTKTYLVKVKDSQIMIGRNKPTNRPCINIFLDRGDPSDSNNISAVEVVKITTMSMKRGGDDQEKELNGIMADVIYELNYANRKLTSVSENWNMVRMLTFNVQQDPTDDRIVFVELEFTYIWTGA